MNGDPNQHPLTQPEPNLPGWEATFQTGVCEQCSWTFMYDAQAPAQRCPHCFSGELSAVTGDLSELPVAAEPELVLPAQITQSTLHKAVLGFTRHIPFAPQDLTAPNLLRRLRRVYLPVWLVDADAQATWRAEMGFDYQVVSHQDRYDDYRGGWSSQEIQERRTRWEPRLGKLNRSYSNIAAPALEAAARIQAALGPFDSQTAQAFAPEWLEPGDPLEQGEPPLTAQVPAAPERFPVFLRLPDRTTKDAWVDATSALQTVAAGECRQAAGADHVRQFSWTPDFTHLKWSLLLQPIATTYYLDDEGRPHSLLVHGQTGRVHGSRKASMQRSQRASLILLGVALVLCVVGFMATAAGVMAPFLLAAGGVILAAGMLMAVASIFPVAIAWFFNRAQPANQNDVHSRG